MTETLTKNQILAALKGVKGPDLSDNIVSLGLVSEVVIHKGKVYFAISVDPARAEELEGLRQAAESVVKGLPGVVDAKVTLTADRALGAGAQARPLAQRQARRRDQRRPRKDPLPVQAHPASPVSARLAFPASRTSLPLRPAKVVSASPPRPSILRSR